MNVTVAKRAGFCFGVKRAINMAFEVAGNRSDVFTLGPLIHNPQVISSLQEAGMHVASSIGELKRKGAKTVIVRTHGIPISSMTRLLQEGFDVIDLTCPYVKKAQHYAKLLKEEGYQVIILGDIEHPEVKGLKSYAGRGSVVVKDDGALRAVRNKVGLVVQTTQPVEALKRLVQRLAEQTREMKVFNTICSSTALRLIETEQVARAVDIMLVVGGKNSANTAQLARLCQALRVPTHHIETADELDGRWFKGAKKIGLTAGASTPDWIIKKVEQVLKEMGGSKNRGT